MDAFSRSVGAIFDIGRARLQTLQWSGRHHCRENAMLELIGVLGVLVSIIVKLIFVQIGCGRRARDGED
ncbi:hypothetical protein [Janthinobacterium sp.]|uniref:hypothetical protein n=1 Tax=Janthinobacterium sp. TaxID=1871054 RepID=UPI0028A1CA1D|nr:hypothetical protein [Janthinobacterium sp.]